MLDKLLAILKEDQVNRDYFFRLVRAAYAYGSQPYKLIEDAYIIAKDAHRDQFRLSGERYFEHVRAVMLIQFVYLRIRNPFANAAALTHDAPEDSSRYPITRIEQKLGQEVAWRVDWGNKRRFDHIPDKQEQDRRYLLSMLLDAPREVAEWKLPDVFHNSVTLWDASPEKIAKKIQALEFIYLPLAEKYGILVYELEAAYESLKRGEHLLPLSTQPRVSGMGPGKVLLSSSP